MKTNCLRTSVTLVSTLMAVLSLAQGASGAMITGLFNTGVDDNGQVLPPLAFQCTALPHFRVGPAANFR